MLKLMMTNECWRECLADLVDEYETDTGETLSSCEIDQHAEELRKIVLDTLTDENIEYCTAHTQKVGAFVIVQNGPKYEREAFDDALDAALDIMTIKA